MSDDFELINDITQIETIAVNLSIREHRRLKKQVSGQQMKFTL